MEPGLCVLASIARVMAAQGQLGPQELHCPCQGAKVRLQLLLEVASAESDDALALLAAVADACWLGWDAC